MKSFEFAIFALVHTFCSQKAAIIWYKNISEVKTFEDDNTVAILALPAEMCLNSLPSLKNLFHHFKFQLILLS